MNIVDCWVLLIFLPHLYAVHYECIQEVKVSCEHKKRRRRKGGKKSPRFSFLPFACYNGFRMHARSMISPILYYFSSKVAIEKRKERKKKSEKMSFDGALPPAQSS